MDPILDPEYSIIELNERNIIFFLSALLWTPGKEFGFKIYNVKNWNNLLSLKKRKRRKEERLWPLLIFLRIC